MPSDKTCAGVRPHFSEQLDGEPVSFIVRFHMAICPPCRRFRRSLVATQAALAALRDTDVAEEEETRPKPADPP